MASAVPTDLAKFSAGHNAKSDRRLRSEFHRAPTAAGRPARCNYVNRSVRSAVAAGSQSISWKRQNGTWGGNWPL
jgi:hypothetical protein